MGNFAKRILICMFLLIIVSSVALCATWVFATPPSPIFQNISLVLNNFSYEPPEAVYITNVQVVSVSNQITNHTNEFSFPTYLATDLKVNQSNVSVTYKITVYNNTDVTQWYTGMFYQSSYGSNTLLTTSNGVTITTKDKSSDSSKTFNTNDYVPPKTSRDFYATYSFGSTAAARNNISMLVNYKFGVRMDSVYDGFLAVLNNPDTYEILADAFDDNYASNKTTVLSNKGTGEALFDLLFGENITINVDGVDVPVTVTVERKNVDKRTTGDKYEGSGTPSGCEYTVYITVDTAPGKKAEVYAISYSKQQNGDVWYQIGQLYQGTANLNSDSTVNVTDWKASAKTYTVGDQISYKVGYEQGTEYDKHLTVEQIMSSQDQEIFNKIDNSGIFKKTYDILKANNNSDAPEVVLLREAFEKASPYYYNYNNGQEFKVNRNYTRSELLPYIIKIQAALDYYYQVHE